MRRFAKPWLVAAAVALLAAAVCAVAQAQLATLTLKSIRCSRHACRTVKPRTTIVLSGSGFQPATVVVFNLRHGNHLINGTRAVTFVSPTRLRARVPSNAWSGAVYVLAATGRSNPIWLNVRARGGTCPSNTGPGDEVTRWRPVVICVLGLLHQPQTNAIVDDVLTIIRGESGGDPAAVNNWDSNAQAGDPSRGLMQVIGATFDQYRDPALLDNIFDPAANIYAGLAYGIARYGSIQAIPGVKSVAAGGPYRPYKMVVR